MRMSISERLQRGMEIRDAANGDTIPGDPDHGRWGERPPMRPVAEPLTASMMQTPPAHEAVPRFRLPQRPLPPISVAPDGLAQYQKPVGIPQRRAFTPQPL